MAYVRTVRTASGAMAVQIVHASRRGARDIEHGSAHDEAELAALKPVDAVASAGPLRIMSSRAGHLWDALRRGYDSLGFPDASGDDAVFRALVLARIIEPTSKLDALRVLDEAGVTAPSYRTLKRRLPGYAEPGWRQRLPAACAAHAALGPASLVLYDVTVRHEAPVVRVGVRDRRRGARRSAAP